ncbi:MAG: hypothetical protein IPO58_08390 [Betaproteobacteria bacterium]|nr:hypothetical protein [Betaproteobacteria bacterium]
MIAVSARDRRGKPVGNIEHAAADGAIGDQGAAADLVLVTPAYGGVLAAGNVQIAAADVRNIAAGDVVEAAADA